MTDEELISKLRGVVKDEVQAGIKPIILRLDGFESRLDGLESGQKTINNRLNDPEYGLEAMNNKLDALSADMIRVQQLTATTNDLVHIVKEKHEEELDEIRNHTHMLPAHRVSLKA